MRRALRVLAAVAVALLALAALVALAFPQWMLEGVLAARRLSAGLSRHEVQVGGDRIVYLTGGAGPPVVLLHGFGGGKDAWAGVAEHLEEDYSVVIPDLPGFGESTQRGPYDPASQAARLRAFLDAIGIAEHHLAGLSMGGEIAAFYAAAQPERVMSLMLVGAPGVRTPEQTPFMREAIAGATAPAIRSEKDFDTLLSLVFFRPPRLPWPVKRILVQQAIARQDADAAIFADIRSAGDDALAPQLPKITARTLIAWGAQDQMVHPSAVGVYAGALPRAQTALFPECGHDVVSECGGALARRYLHFLGEHR